MNLPGYDQWKTTEPENDVPEYGTCGYCGEPIVVGEDYVSTVEGDITHPECFNGFAWEILGAVRKTAK